MGDNEGPELVEAALDLLLYAPLGLAVGCTDLLPELAERGRNHVRNAQAIGKFAVDAGQKKVNEALTDGDSPVGDILRGLGLLPDRDPIVADRDTPAPAPGSGLPIDGYDELPAAQIVPLLAALDPADLARVRAHEESGRARKTILSRIGQLERRSA